MTDAESNCFQWLEDLRVLFIEGEDEQRATIPSNGPTIPHDDHLRDLMPARRVTKQLGLQLKGLDSKSISDLCTGKKTKITFTFYGSYQQMLTHTKKNQSWKTYLSNIVSKGTRWLFKKSLGLTGLLGSGGLVGGLMGYYKLMVANEATQAVLSIAVLVASYALIVNPVVLSEATKKAMVEKQFSKDFGALTKIKDASIKIIDNEKDPDRYEFRVTVQRKSLVEAKKDDKGEKVPFLAKPTSRPQTFKF